MNLPQPEKISEDFVEPRVFIVPEHEGMRSGLKTTGLSKGVMTNVAVTVMVAVIATAIWFKYKNQKK